MKCIAVFFLAVCVSSVAALAADPVTVAEDATTFTLSNGVITALVSKHSGDLISMKFKGAEMLATFMKDGAPDLVLDPPGDPGHSQFGMTDHNYGFWSHDTVADRIESKITIDPKSNDGERGEVSVKGFSDGKKLGHGPGAPQDGDFAADIEIRFALGRGDSGVYTYCTFDHKPEYPNATLGEARFCVKLSSIFDWMLVDDHHNMYYPPEPEANGWDDKYNYTTTQFEHPAFGWASVEKNQGFFIVNASVEYLTGPPTKVEFECHRDTNQNRRARAFLNYWRSSHYGGGGVDVAKGEHWTKVIGPFLLYCNTGNNPQTIWADAIAQQRRESAKWPFDWVDGVDYPHKNQRSTVSGQMVLSDPLMPGGGGGRCRNLRVGLSYPDYTVTTSRPSATNMPAGHITWQTDSKHYEFWVHGDDNTRGVFEFRLSGPGIYTMHAIADGVLGEYAKADVTIEAGKDLDLGKITRWTPVRRGQQVWEIGTPNRSGAEFFKGDDYFHDGDVGLGICACCFRNDVNFTIGKSDTHKDWFYLQVPHADDATIAADDRGCRSLAHSVAGLARAERPTTRDVDLHAGRRLNPGARIGCAGRGRAAVEVAVDITRRLTPSISIYPPPRMARRRFGLAWPPTTRRELPSP